VLVPLSDYAEGTALRYKLWVCTNPACGGNVKIRRGQLSRDEPVRRVAPT
jgi:hypothetical protein